MLLRHDTPNGGHPGAGEGANYIEKKRVAAGQEKFSGSV